MSYEPQAKTAAILDRAWQIVQETPYEVTARFVFYQLLGEGWYTPKDGKEKKAAYKDSFLKALSKARHHRYKGWRPDTLVDDTREPVIRGNGFVNVEDWLVAVQQRVTCSLDLWHTQPHYVELWCEHAGMSRQFAYYTEGITIRAMAGQASIAYKYQAAIELDAAARRYDKRPVILYFGDYDPGGKKIAEVIKRDIGRECRAGFSFEWCGITPEHVQRYNLPDNPEKPGEYQWEALGDAHSGEVIRENVARFVRLDAMSEVQHEAQSATEWLRGELEGLTDKWQDATP